MATIKQKSAFVEVEGGERIEVRRMRWKAHREFFKKFAAIAVGIFRDMSAEAAKADGGNVTGVAAPDLTDFVGKIMQRLPEIVSQSDELATLIGCASTDLSPSKFDDLDGLVALNVISEAISINCDDEVKNCLAEIGAKVAGLVSAKTKMS